MMASLLAGGSPSHSNLPPSTSIPCRTASAIFPELPSIDRTVYEQIQKTCSERWQLDKMKMDTFNVRPDRDEYVVECEEIVDGELYRCVIRVNSAGEWINDGRGKKTP